MVEKLARFPAEVVEHAVGDIRDVRGAFLEILVIDCGNRGDVPLHDSCENHVRRLKLLADAVVDLLHEHFVVDDQQVRFKDACLLGSERGFDARLKFENLRAGFCERRIEPGCFRGNFRLGDGFRFQIKRRAVRSADDEGDADRNAGGGRDPVVHHFIADFTVLRLREGVGCGIILHRNACQPSR